MKRTKLRTALIALSAASMLAAVGCNQGPVDTKDLDEVEEPLAQEAVAPEKAAKKRRAFHDPSKLIEKFDENEDGVLQLSELPERKAKFFDRADTDKDGALSTTELKAHWTAMKKKKFERRDSNGDGFLTEDEVGRRWERLKVADADNDGKLTQVEIETAWQNGKLFPRHGKRGFRSMHHRKDPGKWFDKLDENKNGLLELSEVPERKRPWLEKADTNGDKALSKDELKAHFEAKRGKFMKRRKGFGIDKDVSPTL